MSYPFDYVCQHCYAYISAGVQHKCGPDFRIQTPVPPSDNWFPVPPSLPVGCICPPGANLECQSPRCPANRRSRARPMTDEQKFLEALELLLDAADRLADKAWATGGISTLTYNSQGEKWDTICDHLSGADALLKGT